MSGNAIAIIAIVIGILIMAGGIYYLVSEKEDKESRQIYGIVTVIGAVIAVIAIVILCIKR